MEEDWTPTFVWNNVSIELTCSNIIKFLHTYFVYTIIWCATKSVNVCAYIVCMFVWMYYHNYTVVEKHGEDNALPYPS